MESTSSSSEMVVLDVDMELIFSSIDEKLSNTGDDQRKSESGTIYRAPEFIRRTDPNTYVPRIVSIGPYHRKPANEVSVDPMEHVKGKYLGDLIRRGDGNTVRNYIRELSDASFLAKTIKCYSEPVDCSDGVNSFVEMMVMDGCFILEFLLKTLLNEEMGEFVNFNRSLVENDLLMIDNQIPFFVLESLLDSTSFPRIAHEKLDSLVYDAQCIFTLYRDHQPDPKNCECALPTPRYMASYMISRNRLDPGNLCGLDWCDIDKLDVHHLLHLHHLLHYPAPLDSLGFIHFLVGEDFDIEIQVIRDFFVKLLSYNIFLVIRDVFGYLLGYLLYVLVLFLLILGTLLGAALMLFTLPVTVILLYVVLRYLWKSSWDPEPRLLGIPTATVLHQYGIKFKGSDSRSCFLNVTFDERKGVMKVPFLSMNELTVFRLRHLVMFEQYNPTVKNHFTSYIKLMDSLIDTAEDVALLHQSRVLERSLGGDEELAQLFNNLGKGVRLNYDKHYLTELFDDVNKYCSHRRHRWWGSMMNNYFKSPWSTISAVAAVILLLLTLCQTVFAVLAYFRPP